MIVEAGFADGDDFCGATAPYEFGRRHVELLMCIMRMSAKRGVNIRKAVRYRKHFALAPNARRDRNHTLDTGGAGARHHRIELIGKIREIEMAMAVDQHWHCAAGST